MTSLQFFVAGTPVPKGSGRAFYNKHTGKAHVIQDNSRDFGNEQKTTAITIHKPFSKEAAA